MDFMFHIQIFAYSGRVVSEYSQGYVLSKHTLKCQTELIKATLCHLATIPGPQGLSALHFTFHICTHCISAPSNTMLFHCHIHLHWTITNLLSCTGMVPSAWCLLQKGTSFDFFYSVNGAPFFTREPFSKFCGKRCPLVWDKGTVLVPFSLKWEPFSKTVPKGHCFGSLFFLSDAFWPGVVALTTHSQIVWLYVFYILTGIDDWELNPHFSCSSPSAEKCGVPASCCAQQDSKTLINQRKFKSCYIFQLLQFPNKTSLCGGQQRFLSSCWNAPINMIYKETDSLIEHNIKNMFIDEFFLYIMFDKASWISLEF